MPISKSVKAKVQAKSGTPKITCFTTKASKGGKGITSPEYSMSGRATRNSNKQEEAEDQPEVSTDTEAESETGVEIPFTHSGVLPCPKELDFDQVKELPSKDQMEVLVNAFNKLCAKITEIDIVLNHDTDGLNTKTAMMQEQLDKETDTQATLQKSLESTATKQENLTAKLATVQSDAKMYRGILQKHSNQLATLNNKVAMLTVKSMEMNITISNLEGDRDPKDKSNIEDVKHNVVVFLRESVGDRCG